MMARACVVCVAAQSALCHGYTIYDMCIIFRPVRAPRIFLDYKLLNAAIIFAQLTVIFFRGVYNSWLPVPTPRRRQNPQLTHLGSFEIAGVRRVVGNFGFPSRRHRQQTNGAHFERVRPGEPDDLFRDLGQGSYIYT